MNKNQKIILAIFIPVILFFIALTIADSVGITRVGGLQKFSHTPSKIPSYTRDPFDMEKTWYVWGLYLIICFLFEYKLFADKKKKDKELKGI